MCSRLMKEDNKFTKLVANEHSGRVLVQIRNPFTLTSTMIFTILLQTWSVIVAAA